MKQINRSLSEKAQQLKDKSDDFFKRWEKAASGTRSKKEHEQTRPLFDEAIKALHEWKEFRFKNGWEISMEKID